MLITKNAVSYGPTHRLHFRVVGPMATPMGEKPVREVKAWLCMAMMVVGVPLTLQIENHLPLGEAQGPTPREVPRRWGNSMVQGVSEFQAGLTCQL